MTGMDLRIERTRHRVKQYKVAAALGMHPTWLCHIERSESEVSGDVADRILAAISTIKRDGESSDCSAA